MKKMKSMEIGERIWELRQDRGLSRDQLASLSGISSKFLYEIEVKGVGFSTKVLEGIVRSLDTSADYILFGRKHSQYDEVIADTIGKFEPGMLKQVDSILKIVYEMMHNA